MSIAFGLKGGETGALAFSLPFLTNGVKWIGWSYRRTWSITGVEGCPWLLNFEGRAVSAFAAVAVMVSRRTYLTVVTEGASTYWR